MSEQIASIALYDQGTLTVAPRHNRRLFAKRLTDTTLRTLRGLVYAVADAEIRTDLHAVRCMMMITLHTMPQLEVVGFIADHSGFDDSQFRLVLTTPSCATESSTYPAQREEYASAVALKQSLLTLAIELTQDN